MVKVFKVNKNKKKPNRKRMLLNIIWKAVCKLH